MTPVMPLPKLANDVADIVKKVMSEIRPKLIQAAVSGNPGESPNERHADNFLSVHDMWMHRRYQDLLGQTIKSFVYASEEADPEIVGSDAEPDLCVLVDPLDTSELAVRALLGYTHVMVYSRSLARPIVSVVGDIFHHIQLYVGARFEDGQDRAFLLTSDAVQYELRQRPAKSLSEALVTNYLMRPDERFVPLSRQERLIQSLSAPSSDGNSRGRIGVDFGSVGLCHVAAGFTDAVIEFAKGFAIWDLAPGHYILHAAGGTVVDLSGREISLDYALNSLSGISAAMDRRQTFVASGSAMLAREILDSLDVP
jgi:myo-inositol-1(or 4)-monophosphatase